MRDDPLVISLVTRAQNGDRQAWDALVEQYAPLIWSICRRHQLSEADAHDVSQNVWLHLIGRLGSIRDPAALPGWLTTTTVRECFKALRVARRLHPAGHVPELDTIPDTRGAVAEQELLLAERYTALREAFTHLPPRCQRLLTLLIEDPPVPYSQISATLGIAVGSIGPSRSRCLQKVRRDPAIAALITAEARTVGTELAGATA